MREPRNPFIMRASEQIESESTFLRLFGPGVLELLPKDNLWDRIQIFRSAPGAGKTSLFRVFTPSALLALHESRADEDFKELYLRLEDLDVISEKGPHVLGIMLSCARNYSALEDLGFDATRKERLLYSLLNVRLILATLRGVAALKNLRYPDDLNRLTIIAPGTNDLSAQMPIPGSGIDLYEWARSIEKKVCETIDSFDPSSHETTEGIDTLYALLLLRPECILCDGVPVAQRILVMLDDIHKMTPLQREKLLSTIFDLRPSIGIWIAERLEALSPNELLASGSTTGREYGKPIHLEDFWRPSANSKRFENALNNIADRRARSARDVQIGSFAGCLQDSLDGATWQRHFETAVKIISDRVRKWSNTTQRYEEWIADRERMDNTIREKAIAWRSLEILIERDFRKAQESFDFALPSEDLERKEVSSARAAAEFFISREFNNPYYFGSSRLAALSSSNIEQFLSFAGELFEEIISGVLLKRQNTLTPDRQETILKKVAQKRWEEIPRRIQNGRDVQKLLEAIHQYARYQTDRPNAPYAPGVTGIAISMSDRGKLMDQATRKKYPQFEKLLLTISSCIAHNLLEPSIDRPQGEKGKTWMILYLNRWLCLQFGLPIQYGGWRSKTPDELCTWLEQGFKPPKKNEGGLL